MRSPFLTKNNADRHCNTGADQARLNPRIYIDEARRLQAEAIADAVRWAGAGAAKVLRRSASACRRLLLALADGLRAAHRYRRLAAMSDAELARLRLTREDVPWFALTGERPERGSSGPASEPSGGEDDRPRVDDPAPQRTRHPRPDDQRERLPRAA